MIYTVAGALCWFFSVGNLVALGINGPVFVRMGHEHGWAELWASKTGPIILI